VSEEFDGLLRGAFPEATDHTVLRVVSQGIALADDVRRNTVWMAGLIGSDIRGNLRRAAAMWAFRQACASGELPFKAEEKPNTTGSSHLLEIRSGSFEARMVRTESAKAFPKDAPIRQNKSLKNQADLFEDGGLKPLDVLVSKLDCYAWLSFNADPIGNVTHMGWVMPSYENKSILGFVNVLRSGIGMDEFSAFNEYSPPKPDPLALVKFTDELEEKLKKIEQAEQAKRG
jgi:hypothetical protein